MIKYNFEELGFKPSNEDVKMASKSLSQVELAIMSWSDAQLSNWQSMVKDGRKISSVSLNIAVDKEGTRSYDVAVDYLPVETPAG